MRTFNLTQAIRYTNEVLVEVGKDYVYNFPTGFNSCVYYAYGQPSCIVGLILAKAGLKVQVLGRPQLNGLSIASASSQLLAYGFSIDDRTTEFLFDIQAMQDARHSWGECVTYALAEVMSKFLGDMVRSQSSPYFYYSQNQILPA